MAFLNEETVLEVDGEGNPTKIHGFACAFCPGSGTYEYHPPEGWIVESCKYNAMGTHGCCPSCVVVELVISLTPLPMPPTVSVTATSTIPLWMWDEDGIAKIPCTRNNPVTVGMGFGIAVSEEGENNKTTIVTPHVDTPEPETIHFNITLSDPLAPSHLRGTYIGNVIVNGGAGNIHVNLTSFTPERKTKTVSFASVPAGGSLTVD